MKDYKTENIVNCALAGHASSGKTTIAESLSFCAGAMQKCGSVDAGTSISDYRKQEVNSKHSIGMSLLNFTYLDKKINLIDTPGYIDFIGDMKAGLGVSEIAGIVVNSSEGIEVGTELAWEYATNNKQAKMFIINMLDKSQSNYEQVLISLKERFGRQIFPLMMPVNEGESFNQIADVLKKKILDFSTDGSGNFS